MPEDKRTTSEIQMLATEVVRQQARYCESKMENVENKLAELTRQMEKLMVLVERMRDDDQKMREAVVDLRGRWRLFTVVAGIVGFIGTLTGIIGAILALR